MNEQHLEHRGEREPPDVAVRDPVPGLLEAEQLGQHEVQERDGRDDEDHRAASRRPRVNRIRGISS